MMRTPALRRDAYPPHSTAGRSGLPEEEFTSAIQGLTVLPPDRSEQDAIALQYQPVAELIRDIRLWQAATEQWQKEYQNTHSGPDAGNATEDALAFHAERFRPLREKYAGNPLLARALHNHGSRISTRGIGAMQGYAQTENERFVESVLAEEERQLRGIMTSPSSTRQARTEAFMEYTFKAEKWRQALGQSPEAITAWKESFRHELLSEAMHTRFERILAAALIGRSPLRVWPEAKMPPATQKAGFLWNPRPPQQRHGYRCGFRQRRPGLLQNHGQKSLGAAL